MLQTAERLRQYYEFDQDILEQIEDVATQQNELSFRELADAYNLGEGPKRTAIPYRSEPIEYLELLPEGEYDHEKARVYYAPMAIPADANMAIRAMRWFAADPSQPLYVFGNAGAIGHGANRLKRSERRIVASGDLAPAVKPSLDLMEQLGVRAVGLAGFSYGAELTVAAANRLSDGDYHLKPEKAVAMEMVSVGRHSRLNLGYNFAQSGAELGRYVSAADSLPYQQARAEADTGFARYAAGLLRLSNLAIIKSMTQNAFITHAREAISRNPDLALTVISGTSSELVKRSKLYHHAMLLEAYPANRFRHMEMRGMHHAGGDDIDLHAAMVIQGFRRPLR